MEGLLWLLILGGLFYFMMRFGCGAHGVHGHGSHGGHGHQAGHGNHAGHGSGGSDGKDPVCGMAVPADQGYAKMHEGTLYRFCSRNCLDRFEAEPNKYLNAAAGHAGGAA
jgi:YHS domain-containing protein